MIAVPRQCWCYFAAHKESYLDDCFGYLGHDDATHTMLHFGAYGIRGYWGSYAKVGSTAGEIFIRAEKLSANRKALLQPRTNLTLPLIPQDFSNPSLCAPETVGTKARANG